jgi:hypothetical protein
MDSTKTLNMGEKDVGEDGSLQRPKHMGRKTLPRHLPESYLPSAAGAPSAQPDVLPGMGGQGPGSLRHAGGATPAGWDAFAGGPSQAPQAPRRRRTKEGKEPQQIEVWGMRIVAVLLVAVAYLELKDVSFGPDGFGKQKKRRWEDKGLKGPGLSL